MKTLVYSGAHPEFVIDDLDPTRVLVAGEPFEAPDELAARLLEQDTYSEVKPAGKPSDKTTESN